MLDVFYLGTHHPHWLSLVNVPLFVSDRRLRRYRRLPRAAVPWALDSGAFSELLLHGGYTTTPQEYADRAERYADEVGRLQWAAPQDWMCEPFMLKKTGLTVREHQDRTIRSVVTLRGLSDGVRFIPVLQGYTIDDYVRHVDQYAHYGMDLTLEHTVGLGSVCRRQATRETRRIVRVLHGLGLRLHGFGVKTGGLALYHSGLRSADSLAWSYAARRHAAPFFSECIGVHKNCANCLKYALHWRDRALIDP